MNITYESLEAELAALELIKARYEYFSDYSSNISKQEVEERIEDLQRELKIYNNPVLD